jgi:hypothetical protein
MRIPDANEVRYLVSTTAAYGARGISYYVYNHPKHFGAIASDDGTPTPLYHALKIYNREFAAIARDLLPLQSLAVYHTAMKEQGCEPLPAGAPFYLDNSKTPQSPRGFLLGYFGKNNQPTHVMVVNLDYRAEAVTSLVGPGKLQIFNALAGKWSAASKPPVELRLAPGESRLARLAK